MVLILINKWKKKSSSISVGIRKIGALAEHRALHTCQPIFFSVSFDVVPSELYFKCQSDSCVHVFMCTCHSFAAIKTIQTNPFQWNDGMICKKVCIKLNATYLICTWPRKETKTSWECGNNFARHTMPVTVCFVEIEMRIKLLALTWSTAPIISLCLCEALLQ